MVPLATYCGVLRVTAGSWLSCSNSPRRGCHFYNPNSGTWKHYLPRFGVEHVAGRFLSIELAIDRFPDLIGSPHGSWKHWKSPGKEYCNPKMPKIDWTDVATFKPGWRKQLIGRVVGVVLFRSRFPKQLKALGSLFRQAFGGFGVCPGSLGRAFGLCFVDSGGSFFAFFPSNSNTEVCMSISSIPSLPLPK